MPATAVHIERLTHRYGTRVALQDVSFAVAAGSLFGVLGPNGSGKTTLFRILSTLMPPSDGTARVFDLDTTQAAAAVRQRIGFVFQSPALDDNLTVRENLRFHGALYGLRRDKLRTRIDVLLEQFDVTDRAGDRTGTLSGGLRRRVDLARGLLHRPDLLLLDEPTTGLDPVARHTFWQVLDRLRRTESTTMLLATHLMDEAERCDAVAILDRGRLVTSGPPATLKAALGEKTLWLETDDPHTLRDRIQARFGLDPRVIGSTVHIAHPDAPHLLASLYDALGDEIERATVRAPTLDDVFMAHTGRRVDEALHIVD